MFKLLKKLFHSGDPLLEAVQAGDPVAFAETFRHTEVFVASLPIEESLDPDNLEQEECLALMEKAAQATAAAEEISPFTLEDEEGTVLPVFTSAEATQGFIQAYVEQVHRVMPFLTGSLDGASLLPLLDESVRIVLDMGSPSEQALPESFLAELRKGAEVE